MTRQPPALPALLPAAERLWRVPGVWRGSPARPLPDDARAHFLRGVLQGVQASGAAGGWVGARECGDAGGDVLGPGHKETRRVNNEVPKPTFARHILFDAIHAERERQDRKWGGPRHDDEHSRRDWIAFIVEQAADASKAVWPRDYEAAMIKVAAVAIAAIESQARRVAHECEADKDYPPAAPAEVTGDE